MNYSRDEEDDWIDSGVSIFIESVIPNIHPDYYPHLYNLAKMFYYWGKRIGGLEE